jgi:hypothetical protein
MVFQFSLQSSQEQNRLYVRGFGEGTDKFTPYLLSLTNLFLKHWKQKDFTL